MMISKFVWAWQIGRYDRHAIVVDGSCPPFKVRIDQLIGKNEDIPDGWVVTDELFRCGRREGESI